jgi:hypothetical protein
MRLITSLQLPSAQAKRDLYNFFPCFKKNDIALGFKVVSGYGFQSYGYVFPISLAKNQTQHGFELSPCIPPHSLHNIHT